MVTAGQGIELATTTPQAAITDGSDAATTQAAVNAVIVALENVGIIIPN